MHEDNAGHMTKMASMLIYGKTLCMKHQRPKPVIFCPNYDPGLTLTYLMVRLNFATRL